MDINQSQESDQDGAIEAPVAVPVALASGHSTDGNPTHHISEAVLVTCKETQEISSSNTPNLNTESAAADAPENTTTAAIVPTGQQMKSEENDMDVECSMECDTELAGNPSKSVTEIRSQMLNRVAKSDAHFKHQQRGDPDLTDSEKLEIATKLLEKPSVFLSRFGKFVEAEDLSYFHSVESDYVIDFHLKEIKERLNVHKSHVVVRNRRFEAMKQLIAGGEYFSDEELKYRDPLLYEQMVGQHLSDEEVAAQVNKSDLRFSTILIQNLQMIQNNEIYAGQKEQEAIQMDESDEEKASDLESDESELESDDDEKLPHKEKDLLRAEFLRTMQLRFLNGEDKDFNYSEVDTNVEYDSLDIRERDEQEKYFDEEEPEMLEETERDIRCDNAMEKSKENQCAGVSAASTSNPDQVGCHEEKTVVPDALKDSN